MIAQIAVGSEQLERLLVEEGKQLWEALQGARRKLVHEARRQWTAREAARQVEERQSDGVLVDRLDPKHLLLAMIALTAYPLAFPQVTRLVTGRSGRDPAFQKAHRAFLRQFSELLRGGRP